MPLSNTLFQVSSQGVGTTISFQADLGAGNPGSVARAMGPARYMPSEDPV